MFSARSIHLATGLCRHDGETTRKDREPLTESAHGYGGDVDFAGIENAYFAQMLAPMDGVDAERCGIRAEDRFVPGEEEANGALFDAELRYPLVTLPPGGEESWRVLAYYGPKDWAALERAGHELTEVVNLGTLAVIARQFARLLGWLHGWTGNWGLAIILLTILVRIALYPLVERQFRAMAPMRRLKPELDEINKKYADDLEKRQAAMMALYQKHGINPLSQMFGCLPLLLQMPVFFALYTSLSTNVELYHQPFALWWRDLSAPDPYFVLPLLLVGLMHVQQRMTPAAMDPQQQKIMMIVMPVMMGLFMLFLPSGLCLYMMTNSVLGMGQQQLNQWRTAREDASRAAQPGMTPERPGDAPKGPVEPAKETASAPVGRSPKRRPSRG
jgi:YidC/Oxa1 family membrane protein insertase